MPTTGSKPESPTGQRYSYVSCNLTMYEDGGGDDDGGGGGGSCGGDAAGNDGVSMSDSSNGSGTGTGGNGSDFDDNSSGSWTEDSASFSASSSSSSGGGSTDSDADAGKDTLARRGKWLKSLWKIIERIDGERGSRRSTSPNQPPAVKSILRPPTTYKYVIGMSGLPSKVAIYPKWT